VDDQFGVVGKEPIGQLWPRGCVRGQTPGLTAALAQKVGVCWLVGNRFESRCPVARGDAAGQPLADQPLQSTIDGDPIGYMGGTSSDCLPDLIRREGVRGLPERVQDPPPRGSDATKRREGGGDAIGGDGHASILTNFAKSLLMTAWVFPPVHVHHEVGLGVTLGGGGGDLNLEEASAAVWTVGRDMTYRDSQSKAKAKGRLWDVGVRCLATARAARADAR